MTVELSNLDTAQKLQLSLMLKRAARTQVAYVHSSGPRAIDEKTRHNCLEAAGILYQLANDLYFATLN